MKMNHKDKVLLINIINDNYLSNLQLLNIIRQQANINDEEDNFINCALYLYCMNRQNHLRIPGYCEEWLPLYIESDFYSLFRMTRETFYTLLERIDSRELHKPYLGGEMQIAAEKQLMMTLWWLGKGEVLLSVADKFNVSLSTVFNCTEFILSRLLILKNTYIVWPDRVEIPKIETDFRARNGYPGVIGAIDVCNIPFKAPLNCQESYIDRKLTHSIKLQAITTADKIFTNICVGFPGSAHDSRVFKNSHLYLEIEQNGKYRNYFPLDRYHIIGDSAYPLLNWVMTPYRDNGNLNNTQRRHNTYHSVTRVVVEHTFGILKSRWRILKYINVNSVEKAVHIIAACCILHNYCYVNNDFWQEYEPMENDNYIYENARNLNINSINKRNEIANILML